METEHDWKDSKQSRKLTTVAFAVAAVFAVTSSAALAAEVIYNDLESPKPGNVVSLGFEATQTSSFGGQVEFGGTARNNPTVGVIMSSWACQSGTWNENCISAKGAKFEWPITFTVNAVGPGNSVGALLGSGSKVFKIAYRPSASAKCTGESAGAWYHMGECFHGKALKLNLPLKIANLPSKAIVTISYNTSDYGATPQRPQACNSEPQGCPYDSLNVGVQDGFETRPARRPRWARSRHPTLPTSTVRPKKNGPASSRCSK